MLEDETISFYFWGFIAIILTSHIQTPKIAIKTSAHPSETLYCRLIFPSLHFSATVLTEPYVCKSMCTIYKVKGSLRVESFLAAIMNQVLKQQTLGLQVLHKHACACTKHTVLFLHLWTYIHRHTVWLSFIFVAEEKKTTFGRLIQNETQRTVNPSWQSIRWERQQQNNTRGNQTQVTSNSPLEVLLWRKKWNQWNQHHFCSQRSRHKSITFILIHVCHFK